jgi:hypothetical protein
MVEGSGFESTILYDPGAECSSASVHLNRRAQTRLAFGARGRGFGARCVGGRALVLELATLTGRMRTGASGGWAGRNKENRLEARQTATGKNMRVFRKGKHEERTRKRHSKSC